MIQPHPDCKAPHKEPNEWTGPTHACAGPNCPSVEHKPRVRGAVMNEDGAMDYPTDEHKAEVFPEPKEPRFVQPDHMEGL